MEARYPGDPRARPSRAFCAVSATGSIRRRRDDLISKAVVCSFDGNSHEVDTIVAGDMLREKFNLCHGQYQLVKHFPEQFFIIFPDARTKQWAIDRRSVSYRGREFHFGDWSEESYARKTSWEFRVKVRVEGIPVHCWGEEVASRALGRSCTIHYVQERSRRRERTRSFDLWAWCSDPCEIPKEVWLTVSEPDSELPPISTPLPLVGAHHAEPTDLKKGHVYTLRNHIEVVEDLCLIHGRNTRGGPMNRKPRREFVWSYGVSDSAGEKRERSVEFRGRETMRRDWDHDDDEDFHQHRHQDTRRQRSLSGWARSSRCRGGVEDCYSSSGRYRPSTPFRRRGMGMGQPGRWIPKIKNKKVSFADPVITAIWPTDVSKGRISAENSISLGGMDLGTQAMEEYQCSAHPKVSVPIASNSVNALIHSWSTRGTDSAPVPIISGSHLANETIQGNLCIQNVQVESNFSNSEPNSQRNVVTNEDRQCFLPSNEVPPIGHESSTHSTPRSLENQLNSNDRLQIFIESITNTPEPPLILSPPNSNTLATSPVLGGSDNLDANVTINAGTPGKRSSSRLAAKQRLNVGGSRDAISKAQEILIAKLNNSAAIQYQGSSASTSNNHVNSFEQIEGLFSRPLSKDQMEAIMELANQGKGKKGSKLRGCKVAPLKAPIIKAASGI
jgi:hypothetical protein